MRSGLSFLPLFQSVCARALEEEAPSLKSTVLEMRLYTMKHTNMFRRGAALLFSLVLVLSMLAGCGNDASTQSSTPSSSTVSQAQESASQESASESGAASETSQLESESGMGEKSESGDASQADVQEKEITFQVVHKDGTTKDFTITTQAANLREALEAEGLIAGEESSYGLFVKTVDGETVDDANKEWWCLTKGGQMWNYGVDDTEISDGDAFEFTFTVGY